MAFELHQSKRKWLFLGIYKPASQNDIERLRRISLILEYYLPTYENFVVTADFNLHVENSHLEAITQGCRFEQFYQKTKLSLILYSKLY